MAVTRQQQKHGGGAKLDWGERQRKWRRRQDGSSGVAANLAWLGLAAAGDTTATVVTRRQQQRRWRRELWSAAAAVAAARQQRRQRRQRSKLLNVNKTNKNPNLSGNSDGRIMWSCGVSTSYAGTDAYVKFNSIFRDVCTITTWIKAKRQKFGDV